MNRVAILFSIFAIFTLGLILNIKEQIPNKNNEKNETTRSGALEALEFWTQARAYPDKDIPPDKYYKAYQISKTKMREIPRSICGGSIWDPIGPLNLQGRSISVALNPLNPNTVYVGTASGGLWRSYTGGLGGDWEQVKLGYPALGISAIVIDPTDTNVIYIGTGEVYRYHNSVGGLVIRTTRGSYGIGILKTTNGGQTWTKSLDWSYNQQSGIQTIKMNPLNPHTLWAATTEGLYKTVNSGSTWELIVAAPMAIDIALHLTDTNYIMCSFGNFTNSTTLRSTDGGSNWSVSPIPSYTGKTHLAVYAAHPNVVYASAADSTTGVGGLYRSTDFGASWVKLNNNSIFGVQGWYSHYVAVHPIDSSIIVHNSVYLTKSTNGGQSFTYVNTGYADNHAYAIHPSNPNIIYAVNDDGVYMSTDFGSSYTNIGFGMQSGQMYNGLSCSTTDSLLSLVQSQDHIPGYRYLGSSVWDHNSAVDEVGWTAIDPQNDNIMYAADRFGSSIYKSTNRGASFFYLGSFTSGAWNSPFVVSPSNTNILYFGTYDIYKSTNAGGIWSNIKSSIDGGNPALSMAISSTDPNIVFVGTAPINHHAHIYKTTNGGSNWIDVTGTLPDRYPMNIEIDPQNSNIVYIAFGGFGTGHLFKTTDAGTTWSDMTGILPDVPTTAVIVDPLNSNIVYAGNDIGVYVSTDAGNSWSSFSTGLPDAVIVADLAISPSNRTIRVATHGNGVWERKMLYELPTNYFDYKVAVLNSPAEGSEYNVGEIISPIRASFRNLSMQAQTDSFNVKYRILFEESEVYASEKRIPGLNLAETRTVTFDGTFTPMNTGIYIVQAISLASDNNPSNDTLQSSIKVYPASTVSQWTVNKNYSPYVEITSGSSGPSGDDTREQVTLPFTFRFDNYGYDQAQISTNGWLELGTGTPGSERGLSTEEQLGYYFEQSFGARGRPTKAIGAWWADLNTNGNVGQITYTTIGSAPNRIFIVQWKHMLAFYDPVTTTFLNFQIKLYETSNLIECCYGPVELGYLPSEATGAWLGLKDFLGGNYRFYDISNGGTGPISAMNTTLNPITNWPGADSCYQINTNFQGTSVLLMSGWNLVSLPVTSSDRRVGSIFPTAINGYGFKYYAGYQIADSLQNGSGYWIKSSAAINQIFSGGALNNVSVQLKTGWNIIGSVDHEVPAPSGGIISSLVYGYDGSDYVTTSTIVPGKGYWVKASSNGSILLGPGNEPTIEQKILEPSVSLTIMTKSGIKRTLQLVECSSDGINLDKYELPPLPPGEIFDVRFASQRRIETYQTNLTNEVTYPIQMQSPVYPLEIKYKVNGYKEYFIDELNGNKLLHSTQLLGDGQLTINGSENLKLQIRVRGTNQIPKQFVLKQNYPNPFNPTTTITFDLPSKSNVSLVIYDILGKEVMKLADGEYEPGSYNFTADLSNLASGIYVYRVKAGTFTDVKKMVLTK